jgi:hypothetical protein
MQISDRPYCVASAHFRLDRGEGHKEKSLAAGDALRTVSPLPACGSTNGQSESSMGGSAEGLDGGG